MSTAALTRAWTYADLEETADDRGIRYEIIDGGWFETPSAVAFYRRVQTRPSREFDRST